MRLLTISAICFALLSCSLNAIAADKDFNGRWDLIVHNNSNCTVTCAWWLEVKGAGTPEVKATFVGFPDGSLHELPDLTIRDGVLHFAWDPPARTQRGSGVSGIRWRSAYWCWKRPGSGAASHGLRGTLCERQARRESNRRQEPHFHR